MFCTKLFFGLGWLISSTIAASAPVATSAIITTITSTYLSTTSSVVGSTVSIEIDPDTCVTSTNPATTQCLAGAARASEVPIYDSDIVTLTTKILSTVGYTTIYSDVPDEQGASVPKSTTTSRLETPSSSLEVEVTSMIAATSNGVVSTALIHSSVSRTATSQTGGATASGTNTDSNNNDNNDKSDDDTTPDESLTLGRNIGIAVGISLGIFFVGSAALFYVKKRKRRRRDIDLQLQQLRYEEEKYGEPAVQARPVAGKPQRESSIPQTSQSGADDDNSSSSHGAGQGDVEDIDEVPLKGSNGAPDMPTGGGPGGGPD